MNAPESYPVLRFAEHPNCTPVVVQRINEPSTEAGEEVMGAAGAAIANAFFDATGFRLTRYPLTRGARARRTCNEEGLNVAATVEASRTLAPRCMSHPVKP